MNEHNNSYEEKEILLKAIDLLSMDILRLKSENEMLKITIQSLEKGSLFKGKNRDINKSETIWSRTIEYYHREGFINTIKKIIKKLGGH